MSRVMRMLHEAKANMEATVKSMDRIRLPNSMEFDEREVVEVRRELDEAKAKIKELTLIMPRIIMEAERRGK